MKTMVLLASLMASAIAFACPSNKMCAGDRVIDTANDLGYIVEVFSNGQARVNYDRFGVYAVSVSKLSKSTKCYQSICVNARVTDTANDTGYVKEVFDNGKIRINYDRFGLYIVEASRLSKKKSCHNRICINDRVMDNANDTGVVTEIFGNGKARVNYDRFGVYTVDIDRLGKGWKCIENACVGDRVMDTANDTGYITELFDNGKVRVNYDRFGIYSVDLSKLGYQLNCTLRVNCSCRN